MTEILKKVGMSTDEMKEFVKSGTAKRIDLEKMRALLTSGAMMMSKLEMWVMSTAAAWEGKDLQGRVDYTHQFSDEDLETEITLLTEMLMHPIPSLRENIINLQVRKLLGNYLEPDVLEQIQKDVTKIMGGKGMAVVDSVPNSSTPVLDKPSANTVQGTANKILNNNAKEQV